MNGVALATRLASQFATARPWPLVLLLIAFAGIGAPLAGLRAPVGVDGPSLTDGIAIAAAAIAVCAAILQTRLGRMEGDLRQLGTLRGEIDRLHAQLRVSENEAEGRYAAERALESSVAKTARLTEKNVALDRMLFRLQEDSLVGCAVFDHTGTLTFANDKFRKALGYSMEDLVGRTTDDLTHPEDIPRSLELSLLLRAGAVEQASMEKRYIRKDGSSFTASTRLSAVRDDQGGTEMVIAQIDDRT